MTLARINNDEVIDSEGAVYRRISRPEPGLEIFRSEEWVNATIGAREAEKEVLDEWRKDNPDESGLGDNEIWALMAAKAQELIEEDLLTPPDEESGREAVL